MPSGLK